MTSFWQWQDREEAQDSLTRRLGDTVQGITSWAGQQQQGFERRVQQQADQLSTWAADMGQQATSTLKASADRAMADLSSAVDTMRGPAFSPTPEPSQPQTLGGTFGDTSIGAPDTWPQMNTQQQVGGQPYAQPQPLPEPEQPPSPTPLQQRTQPYAQDPEPLSFEGGTPEGEATLGALSETAGRALPGMPWQQRVLRQTAPEPMTAETPGRNLLTLGGLAVPGGTLGTLAAAGAEQATEANPNPWVRAGAPLVAGMVAGGVDPGDLARLGTSGAARGVPREAAGTAATAPGAAQRLTAAAERFSGQAERVRAATDYRARLWDTAQERLAQVEAQLEMLGQRTGIERPKWAGNLSEPDLVALAERSGVNPYAPAWGDLIDPETIRLYRAEAVREGGSRLGRTGAETAAEQQALRRERTALRRQSQQIERDMDRDLERLGSLTDVGDLATRWAQRVPAAERRATPPGFQRTLPDLAETRLEQAAGTSAQAEALRPDRAGFAGNLNLSKFPAEVRPLLQEQTSFAGQRRGVVTAPAAQAQAAEVALGTTVERWLRSRPGRAFSEPEAVALGNTLAKVGRDYDALLTRVGEARDAGTITPQLERELAERSLEFGALAAVRSGAAAEAGRALRSFRSALTGDVASPSGVLRPEAALAQAFKAIGTDKERFAQWMEEYAKLPPGDTVARYQMLQALYTPTLMDNLTTWRYASMLSSWKTHVANFTSNAVEAGARPTELLLAGYGREAAADVRGMLRGLPEGIAAASRALRSGLTEDMASKTDLIRPGAFLHGLVPALGETGAVGRANVVAGRAVRFPLDALAAADEFWKAVNTSGVLHAEAYRLAKGDAAKAEALLREPTAEMVRTAHAAALRATFQEDPGKWVSRLMQLRATDNPGGVMLQFVLPFVRTPANIFRRGAGLLAAPVTGTIRAGRAAARGDERTARLEVARTVMASTVAGGLAALAVSGRLTGAGPSSPEKRRLLEETGWQSNSVQIGDRWISVTNLGPVGIEAAVIANAWEGYREGQRPKRDIARDVTRRIAESLTDVSYISGIADLFEGVSRGDIPGAITGMASDLAGSLLPYGSGLGAVERLIDPALRSQAGPVERVAGRLPGVSSQVPPELGPYAQPRRTEQVTSLGDLVAQVLLPGRTSRRRTAEGEPGPQGSLTQQAQRVATEVARLEQAGQPVSVRQFLGRRVEYAGAPQTPEQRQALQETFGRLSVEYVDAALRRPDYQRATPAQQAATLTAALGLASQVADLEVGATVARDPEHQARLAWAQTPQFETVKGTPSQIARQNLEIAQARALLSEYRRRYGTEEGEDRLFKDDKRAYKLSQTPRLDSDYLATKRKRIEERYGVDVLQAERAALPGAGNRVQPTTTPGTTSPTTTIRQPTPSPTPPPGQTPRLPAAYQAVQAAAR